MPGDARARGYSEEMIALFELGRFRRLLPRVIASEQLAGVVQEAAAKLTGLRPGTPVAVGAGDVPASATGLGAVEPGIACTLLGANILNCLVVDRPIFEPAEVGLLFCMPGMRWLRAMQSMRALRSRFVMGMPCSRTPSPRFGCQAAAQRAHFGVR